ncbi:arabinan endo-1,5-alpha-L-arabinosidase [Mucilaginibacter rubeus]|uniref:Arabinan endo-1,5-alpha-L-arabinosidase n=1 Tax=Mucilaginibacter rubeus TaxID=2027860 RepID=A0AAE6JLG0_9SPHI|nr:MULTISPECIES: arabinan endo-1,5-alpha-L-arabinosidase [Mucilaginibacter]QEM08112.1 arabinan endo-1,5-alpha-L-arabinosidase [Mucilaginibacter rubeus]QEM20565.1 arabinan endo-1,5-alpha-L-arabinosidase [Mucilaginibacter gossypii]QTE42711.1 arabinan endo-1,5-alpha-L-arabinosidase [Mucilaginibacter rubeus]QTE49312.1 arabinan endo-1,5-alpha-L-arabinosidase [Mucilaginibacter rubeus]QTE54408.1 arabinan endo-1,5-alpha-L-arabinosidase [Mucilaginibacter rubeus]
MKKILLIISLLFPGIFSNAQELRTDISVHDPVMTRQDSTYYIFCTGNGIAMWSSGDRIHWKAEKPVFATPPQWALDAIPGFKGHIWAPDISFYNGLYYLFYSVSAFGKNTSAIGVATNTTLHANDPAYKWVDHGKVIQSIPGKTNWNAIDPNLITDKDGTSYLIFGSFWDGLKLVKLNKDRLSVAEDINNIPTIATRRKVATENLPAVDGNPIDAGGNAIEAPFIFKHDKYFYLFASIDYCCKGPKSTYKMIIGRSKTLKGPYLDKDGIAMNKGGGSILLAGDEDWYGVGHNGVSTFDGADYIIFHGYDAADRGISKLRIERLDWIDGWPVIRK